MLAVVVAASLASCAGAPTASDPVAGSVDPADSSVSDGGTPPPSASRSSGGGALAPGAPGQSRGTNQSGAGAARGAPIRIPARVEDQGRPLAEVMPEIQAGIRDQCGGGLCVTLRTEHRDIDPFDSCAFVMTEPAQRELVPRGSTVVIVAGSGPCQTDVPSDTTTSPGTGAGPDKGTATDSSPSGSESTP